MKLRTGLVVVLVALALAFLAAVGWERTSRARRAPPAAAPLAQPGLAQPGPLPLAEPGEGSASGREVAGEASAPVPTAPKDAAGFEGQVRALDGRPVGFIPIYLASEARAAEPGEPFAESDAAGVFRWSTWTWAELVAESDDLTTVLPAFAGSDACVIVVAARATYGGVVVDEEGLALEGARCSAQMEAAVARSLLAGEERAQARTWTARSGSDGSFRLDGVGWTEGLTLVAELDGFVAEQVPLPPRSSLSLEVRLRRPAPGARSIAGLVVDPSAEPVEGATVGFEEGDTFKGDTVTSDRRGRFTVAAPAGRGSAVLWAVKPGNGPAWHVFADLEAYLASSPPGPLVLTLGEHPESITGVVRDEEGQAVAGAWVFTWDLQHWGEQGFVEEFLATGDFPGRVSTARDGRFVLDGLLPRPYTLHALHPRTLAVASRAHVPAGATDVQLVFTGGEGLRRVAGRVLDPRGAPVAGVMLFRGRRATPLDASLPTPLVTEDAPRSDAQGAFEFAALCVTGTYLLPAGGGIAQQERFPLDPGMDLEHLTITVSRTCRFQLVLRDPDEADSFALLDADDQRMPMSFTLGNTSVGGRGAFELAGGRSEIMEADERARTLVLLRAGREVRRAPIRLGPGEVQVLEP